MIRFFGFVLMGEHELIHREALEYTKGHMQCLDECMKIMSVDLQRYPTVVKRVEDVVLKTKQADQTARVIRRINEKRPRDLSRE